MSPYFVLIIVPSKIGSKSLWTPSADGFEELFVIDWFTAILSISSKNTIPFYWTACKLSLSGFICFKIPYLN